MNHSIDEQISLGPENWVFSVSAVLAIAALVVMLALSPRSAEPQPVAVAAPSSLVCLMFDLPGWKPVSPSNRKRIGELVADGKAEWLEDGAETIDCYERNPDNPRLGEMVERRKLEWWRWKPKKRRSPTIH